MAQWLMESPAIIMGIVLYNRYASSDVAVASPFSWRQLLQRVTFQRLGLPDPGRYAHRLDYRSGGMSQVEPLVKGLFLGLLCLFLLDMGIVAARRFRDFRQVGAGRQWGQPVSFDGRRGVGNTRVQCLAGLGAAALLGLEEGDALLLIVLVASGSCTVPAAMRLALPEPIPARTRRCRSRHYVSV